MALFRALVTSLVILLPVAITSAEWICVNHDRQNCIFVPHGDWTRLESLREAERGDREAKQLLGASVVTSVSIVDKDDPEAVKRKHEEEYEKYGQTSANNQRAGAADSVLTPKFNFYLYDDTGNLIQDMLSIHDIQQILLMQSKKYGLSQLKWLLDKSSHATTTDITTLVPNTKAAIDSLDVLTTSPTPPLANAVQPIAANNSWSFVLNKVQDIVATATEVEITSPSPPKDLHETFEQVLRNQIKTAETLHPLPDTTPFTTPLLVTTAKPTSKTTTSTSEQTTTTSQHQDSSSLKSPSTVKPVSTRPQALTVFSLFSELLKRQPLKTSPQRARPRPTKRPDLSISTQGPSTQSTFLPTSPSQLQLRLDDDQTTDKVYVDGFYLGQLNQETPKTTLMYSSTITTETPPKGATKRNTESGTASSWNWVDGNRKELLAEMDVQRTPSSEAMLPQITASDFKENEHQYVIAEPTTPSLQFNFAVEPKEDHHGQNVHDHHDHQHENHHDHHHHDEHHPDEHHHGEHHHDEHHHGEHHHDGHHHHGFHPDNLPTVGLPETPNGTIGLDVSTLGMTKAQLQFVDVNNELAWNMYRSLLRTHSKENMIFSPLSAASSLAMIFLGARGATSWEINELLKMDEMVSFNPHLFYRDTIDTLSNDKHLSAILKHLYIDQDEEELIEFYKARIHFFYNGLAQKVDFDDIQHKIHEDVNTGVEVKTHGQVQDFVGHFHPHPVGPMATFSANFFKGSWKDPFSADNHVEMDFINLPRGRRLVPVPSVRANRRLNACYQAELDVTAAEVTYQSEDMSLILILPGKQTEFIAGGLGHLEEKLTLESWKKLMQCFHPLQIDLQLPLFKHRSLLELNDTLMELGVKEAFSEHQADFSGVNGGFDLHLSSFSQLNEFQVDSSPAQRKRELDYTNPYWYLFLDRNRRQATEETVYRLQFNRQFLYVLRHNPSGMIVHIGRYYEPNTDQDHENGHDHHHH